MGLAPLLALVATVATAQNPAPAPARGGEQVEYPAQRNEALVRFFSVEGEIKAEALRRALRDLGTDKVEAKMIYGPSTTGSRPGRYFFAVEVPATLKESDVTKALRKGAATVEVVCWTAFEGEAVEVPGGGLGGDGGFAGFSPRDWVLGTSNDLRWVDMLAGRFQFYALPGKIDAATIKDRVHKLLQPYGRGNSLHEVERGSLSWTLALPIEEATARRLEKSIAKLEGVLQAHLDAKTGQLQAQLALEGLHASAPPLPGARKPEAPVAPGGAPAPDADPSKLPAPRARFDVNPILDLLVKEKLSLPAPGAADSAAAPAEKPAGG